MGNGVPLEDPLDFFRNSRNVKNQHPYILLLLKILFAWPTVHPGDSIGKWTGTELNPNTLGRDVERMAEQTLERAL